MLGILISWLIAGVLLVVFSSLLYYNNIITLVGFFVMLLLGIVILLSNVILLISERQMESGKKPYGEMLKTVKSSFLILLALSIIVLGLGLFSYLLNVLDMYELDSLSTEALSVMLIVGLLSTAGSFISWKFAEIGILTAILNAITAQDRNLNTIKRGIEDNRTTIEEKIGNLNKSIKEAEKIERRAKEAIER